jgi:hypothetical protein
MKATTWIGIASTALTIGAIVLSETLLKGTPGASLITLLIGGYVGAQHVNTPFTPEDK